VSSTNRGAERAPRDFYATPPHAYELLEPYLPLDPIYWEPACGDGRIVHWLRSTNRTAYGADIHQCPGLVVADFLQDETRREFIITNPPFSLCMEFAAHAVAHADEVLLLVRLNFLASAKRRDWFRANPPAALFVLSKRPSFTSGGTDSCDYCWMYHGRRFKGIIHP
jgi:hypothetical protein